MRILPGTDHYLKIWQLSQPVKIAETATSDVFKVCRQERDHPDAVLKVFTKRGMEDEAHASMALEVFAGEGAIRLYRHDPGAQLLELLPGPDLTPMVTSGRDDEATEIIAKVLDKIHGAKNSPQKSLPTLRAHFRTLFEKAGDFPEAAALAETLLASETGKRTLHGDIHHQNVLQSKEGWKAIDPKGIFGERTYDAANTLCNPVGMPEFVTDPKRLLRTAGILAKALDLDLKRLLDFACVYACLSACWSLEDGDSPELALQVSVIARTANVASQ